MQIFYGIENYKKTTSTVVTVGTFDGVHQGHQKVLSSLKSEANAYNYESVVVTFSTHPRIFLNNQVENLKFLNTSEEKIFLIKNHNINNLIIIPFDEKFANLNADMFINKFLKNIFNAKTIVIGHDHHIGKGRAAGANEIIKAASYENIKVISVNPKIIDNEAVSSTRIRNALNIGNIRLANKCLGYNYCFSGKVVDGNKLGSKINFPTANLMPLDDLKLIPAEGVYAVTVSINRVIYKAMMNIGYRPTINETNKTRKIIEVHIFNFNNDIYNEEICVNMVDKIRDEIKFDGLDALIRQLENDKITALKILS